MRIKQKVRVYDYVDILAKSIGEIEAAGNELALDGDAADGRSLFFKGAKGGLFVWHAGDVSDKIDNAWVLPASWPDGTRGGFERQGGPEIRSRWSGLVPNADPTTSQANLREACTLASSKVLSLDHGEYTLSADYQEAAEPQSNTVIRGQGRSTVIRRSANSGWPFFQIQPGTKNVTFRDFVLDLNRDAEGPGSGWFPQGIRALGSFDEETQSITYVEGLHLENLLLLNTAQVTDNGTAMALHLQLTRNIYGRNLELHNCQIKLGSYGIIEDVDLEFRTYSPHFQGVSCVKHNTDAAWKSAGFRRIKFDVKCENWTQTVFHLGLDEGSFFGDLPLKGWHGLHVRAVVHGNPLNPGLNSNALKLVCPSEYAQGIRDIDIEVDLNPDPSGNVAFHGASIQLGLTDIDNVRIAGTYRHCNMEGVRLQLLGRTVNENGDPVDQQKARGVLLDRVRCATNTRGLELGVTGYMDAEVVANHCDVQGTGLYGALVHVDGEADGGALHLTVLGGTYRGGTGFQSAALRFETGDDAVINVDFRGVRFRDPGDCRHAIRHFQRDGTAVIGTVNMRFFDCIFDTVDDQGGTAFANGAVIEDANTIVQHASNNVGWSPA